MQSKAQQVSRETRAEGSSNYATAFMVSTPTTAHNSTRSARGGLGRITGVGDIRLGCRRRSGEVGYATLRDVILDEELEENLFSFVMGKGYKMQGEGEDVLLPEQRFLFLPFSPTIPPYRPYPSIILCILYPFPMTTW